MSVRGIGINNFVAMIVRIIFILLALWIEGVGFLEIIWSILEIIWSMADIISAAAAAATAAAAEAETEASTTRLSVDIWYLRACQVPVPVPEQCTVCGSPGGNRFLGSHRHLLGSHRAQPQWRLSTRPSRRGSHRLFTPTTCRLGKARSCCGCSLGMAGQTCNLWTTATWNAVGSRRVC